MEVVFDKRKIMKQMKNGKSIDEINQETGISKRKLNRWKREIKIKTRIKELMDSGNYDEAKELVENLEGSENEITRIVYLTLIARGEGNRDEEKRLSERQLELEPDNVIAMSVLLRIEKEEEDEAIKRGDMSGAYIALIRQKELAERRLTIEPENARTMSTLVNIAKREEEIARENGDTSGANAALARQKELLEKQLTINPNNLIAISILIRIAREEGDLAREEELLERRLTIEPVSGKTLSGLIRVAKERGNIIKAKKLLEKLLQLDPENLIAKRELELFTRWAGSNITY